MKLTVKLFAAARELAGSGEIGVALPTGATVGELRAALVVAAPALAALAERSMVAVNEEYAGAATLLRESDVVALIPPVSGG
jgi:molybdopterin converting factor subunit 1